MNERDDNHSDLDALLSEVPSEEADRLREVWELAGADEPSDDLDKRATEEALRRICASVAPRETVDTLGSRTHEAGRVDDRGPCERKRHMSWPDRIGWRTTIALAALVLIGVLGYWWQQPVTRTAPLGEQLAITLPDGSQVELNSGSILRYRRGFEGGRAVRLDGEAFFDVREGARPFTVRTFNAAVQVLGTTFNVRAWPEDIERSTQVTLVEGRVTLYARRHPDRAIALNPGETRVVDGTGALVDSTQAPDVSIDAATAWRRGDLIFKDRPLGTVLREVERRFAVDLQVKPDALQERRISLGLRQPEGAETVVRDLALALQLRYRETSNGYELYRQSLE